MAVCGFNDRMGEGLRILFAGMYEAILAKSQSERIPFAAVLQREVLEIPCINESLRTSQDSILAMFHGLNDMALAHFKHVLENNPGLDLSNRSVFMRQVHAFNEVLEAVEGFYLSIPPADPRSKGDIEKRARRVGTWIESRYALSEAC